jgi:N-methylhydantoinase A
MHAAFIAEGLGMTTVIVPNHPGNLSAFGLVVASVRRDAMQPYFARGSELDLANLSSQLGKLCATVRSDLVAAAAVPETITLACSLSMRSVGQAHEILVPVGRDPGAVSIETIRGQFDAHYAERYGRAPDAHADFEVVEVYVSGDGDVERFSKDIWHVRASDTALRPTSRDVWFGGQARPTPICARAGMVPAHASAVR